MHSWGEPRRTLCHPGTKKPACAVGYFDYPLAICAGWDRFGPSMALSSGRALFALCVRRAKACFCINPPHPSGPPSASRIGSPADSSNLWVLIKPRSAPCTKKPACAVGGIDHSPGDACGQDGCGPSWPLALRAAAARRAPWPSLAMGSNRVGLSTPHSPPSRHKKTRLRGFVPGWRRVWDSNPRGTVRPQPISNRCRYDRFGNSPGISIF